MFSQSLRAHRDCPHAATCASWRLVVALAVLWLARAVSAQERLPASKPGVQPSYPRSSLDSGYLVDLSWPSRPQELAWGAMAGIARAPADQVWPFHRGAARRHVLTAGARLAD